MNPNKYIALIHCSGVAGHELLLQQTNLLSEYTVKKVLVLDGGATTVYKQEFPDAEIVSESASLIEDTTIDFVMVLEPCNKDMQLVANLVKAGKQVRVLKQPQAVEVE